jgi:hypothetical protein
LATKIYKGKNAYRKIAEGIGRPLKKTHTFFTELGAIVDQDTQLTFEREGARAGHPMWKRYSQNTLKTKSGTYRIQYGTDGTPKTDPSNRGKYRSGVRRYGSATKLLQASREFRKSFKVLSANKRGLKYGTRYKLAEAIMSNPTRNVLFVTNQDRERYNRMFAKFIDKNIRFT